MNKLSETEKLDVAKLVAAVRGSRAAQVLFEYRCRRGEGQVANAQPPGRPENPHPTRRESVLKLELP